LIESKQLRIKNLALNRPKMEAWQTTAFGGAPLKRWAVERTIYQKWKKEAWQSG